MQSIPSYIIYLLTRHECVIVPGLGAFVVSGLEESKNRKAGLLCPRANFLGFNPDIRHNDGLLANTIAKGEEILYKEACRKLSRYVDQITDSLEKQLPVQIAWVGKLALSAERKLLFTPAHSLSCNAHTFGLDNLYLPALDEWNDKKEQKSIRISSKPSVVRRALAIAAVIMALLLVSIPVTDYPSRQPQMAGIIPFPVITLPEVEVAQPAEKPMEEITPYYVVIASLPTEISAQLQMEKFQKEGLSNLGVVSAGNKHRIYIAKFGDKSEANAFLFHFRNEYPQYQNAWLLIQRI